MKREADTLARTDKRTTLAPRPRPSSSGITTGTVRDDLGQLGRLAKQAPPRKRLDEARGVATDYYDHGRKKAGELETQVVDYVRTKPLKSILIAAGVGALLGILISRR